MAIPHTCLAPDSFKVLAHSSIVEPVVYTSSTKNIFLFFNSSGLLIEKAFFRFSWRSFAESLIWGKVCFIFIK